MADERRMKELVPDRHCPKTFWERSSSLPLIFEKQCSAVGPACSFPKAIYTRMPKYRITVFAQSWKATLTFALEENIFKSQVTYVRRCVATVDVTIRSAFERVSVAAVFVLRKTSKNERTQKNASSMEQKKTNAGRKGEQQ